MDKVERPQDMNKLKSHLIVNMIWPDVCRKPDDGKWRNYSREFFHEDSCEVLIVTCQYRLDNQFLQLRRFLISHKQIEIDVHAMDKLGLLH